MGAIFFDDIQTNHVTEILQEIYLDRIYDPFLVDRQNLIIVDIGANIGLSAMYFSKFARTVYAIEPSVQHLSKLQQLVATNGLNNVKILPYAVSGKPGKRKLYHSASNPTAHSLIVHEETKNDFEEVQTITISDFFLNENIDHIDLLKLDSEGEEGDIISSEGFRKNAHKINMIIGEWHDWGFMSKTFFEAALKGLGFHFKWKEGTAGDIFTAVKK